MLILSYISTLHYYGSSCGVAIITLYKRRSTGEKKNSISCSSKRNDKKCISCSSKRNDKKCLDSLSKKVLRYVLTISYLQLVNN